MFQCRTLTTLLLAAMLFTGCTVHGYRLGRRMDRQAAALEEIAPGEAEQRLKQDDRLVVLMADGRSLRVRVASEAPRLRLARVIEWPASVPFYERGPVFVELANVRRIVRVRTPLRHTLLQTAGAMMLDGEAAWLVWIIHQHNRDVD